MVKENLAPIVKLPPDMKAQLQDIEGDLKRAESAIKVLKDLGMDTRAIEEKLEWAKHVRATLLKEFT